MYTAKKDEIKISDLIKETLKKSGYTQALENENTIEKRKRADTVFKKLFFCHNVAPSVNVAIVLSTEVTKNIVVNPLFFHIEKQSCKGVPGLNISPLMVEDISSDAYWATTMAAKNSKGYR